MSLAGSVSRASEPTSQPAAFSNVGMFDTGFESMFAAEQAPKHDAALSDMMRQYGQMPFNFQTSNLR